MTHTTEPVYLVQIGDGTLYSYWRLELLLCDVATNRDPAIRIFKREDHGFVTRYVPVSIDELRKGAA